MYWVVLDWPLRVSFGRNGLTPVHSHGGVDPFRLQLGRVLPHALSAAMIMIDQDNLHADTLRRRASGSCADCFIATLNASFVLDRSFGMAVMTTEQERGLLYSLISRRRSVRQFTDTPIDEHVLIRILTCAQGVNSGDGKRGAPSAHALYPLGLTVLARRVQGIDAGSYVFDPQRNRLDLLAHVPVSGSLLPTSLADDEWLETAPVVIVITADHDLALRHFADQQPDGLRGARYVDVETGAVAQNLYLAAQAENLGGVLVMGVDDQTLARQLTLPAKHKPVALFCLGQAQA